MIKIDIVFARYGLAFAMLLPGLLALPDLASAQTSNGQARRPFWNFAHNPNELTDIDNTITAGGNALEPDIMRFPNSTCPYLSLGSTSPSGLYVYHDATCPLRDPATVEAYLDHVHEVVKNGKNIALIAFDIKTKAAQPDLVKNLHDAVLAHLNNGKDGVLVNILYSVGSLGDAQNGGGVFAQIKSLLGPNEGVQIDGENDPLAVYNELSPTTTNIGFGNGSFGISSGFAPNVLPSIMEASWLRASQIKTGFMISYAFPIPPSALQDEMIAAGVDGSIPDFDEQPQSSVHTVMSMQALTNKINNPPYNKDFYLATAADNPFKIRNQAYGLRIHTSDLLNAGTTADLTFQLTGTCGVASMTIDANYQKLFGRDDVNFITIHSKNLGYLTSLRLSSGSSNTWKPDTIYISSVGFGIPYSDKKYASFGGAGVDSDHSQTQPLLRLGYDCVPPVATPVLSPPANPASWNNSDVTVYWNWADKSGSGLDTANSCPASTTSSGEGHLTLSATCTDNVGNEFTATRQVNVDKTAPVVNCGTADALWHPSDISIACTGSDALSGLAVGADANFSVSTSVPALTETNNAFTSQHQVFDVAGNSSTAGPIGGNKIDKKPPVITIVQPAAITYTHSSTLTLSYTVTDLGSGVASVSPTMNGNTTVAGFGLSSGQAIPLLTSLALGPNTFTINSTDNVANHSLQSVTFTIIVTAQSMIDDVNQFLASGAVAQNQGSSLLAKLNNALPKQTAGQCNAAANMYGAFINEVQAQTGKSITPVAAAILIADAQYLQTHCL